MKLSLLPAALLLQGLLALNAHAAVIVDTSPGPDIAEYTRPWGMYQTQWLATGFELGADTTINSIAGLFLTSTVGSAHISIHSGGRLPGETLFSTQLNLGSTAIGFYGTSGLNWTLKKGRYFLAFESLEGDTAVSSMPNAATAPLRFGDSYYYAFTPGAPEWNSSGDLKLGVRIDGVPAVPEPSTYAMMLAGLALLRVGVKRAKRA
jgi:hypothetical protein